MSKQNSSLARFAAIFVTGFVLVAVVTYIFDPFYQYHAPWFGLPAVLDDRDNQVVGTIRTFSYDSVLMGSSVTENFDSTYLDAHYGTDSLKVIRASGSVADLLYYLEQAHAHQELKRVYWCLDISALTADTAVTLHGDAIPEYLHTQTILDDWPYLFNKEILLEKIPQTLASAYLGINTGGHAYDWSDGKEFSAARAMQAYVKPAEALESQVPEQTYFNLETNLNSILAEIQSHPEITYTVFIPPFSMLWWDCGYANGIGEGYLTALEQALPKLADCENVELYCYAMELDIICDLDQYMDMVHYSPQVSQWVLEQLVSGAGRVTAENVEQVLKQVREGYEYIIEEGIYLYYE